ncbi:MAG: class I SAM-dependent methyltransferase [Crocinitomicaceae bacterium]
MEFISEKIDDYVCAHSEKEPDLLHQLNRETHIKVLRPRMLSGHFQGRVLSMLSHMIQPKNVLEIGTYTGYSALCFAEGLAEGGKILTLDKNEELEDLVNEYIQKSEYKNAIDCRIGDAMEIIPTLQEEYDLVFIDADKSNYINYYNLVFDKVAKGGYIIIDNVLWSGKVVEEVESGDVDTRVLIDLNKLIHEDDRVQEVLFPIRDGLMIARKK